VKIERSDRLIRFRESRKGSIVFVVILCLLILVIDWAVLGAPMRLSDLSPMARRQIVDLGPGFYVMAGLPYLLVPWILRRLMVAVFGRVITFDGQQRVITKNNRILAAFEDVKYLEIMPWSDDNVRLNLFLTSGKKIRVGKILSKNQYKGVPSEIEGFFERPVTRKPQGSLKEDLHRGLSILYYVLRGASVLLFLGALTTLVISGMYTVKGVTTAGRVLNVEVRAEEGHETMGVGEYERSYRTTNLVYEQTIEFKYRQGGLHTFKTTVKAGEAEIGQEIPIIYMPDNPARVRVKSFGNMWGPSILLFLTCLVVHGISWFFKYLRYIPIG
jgi:hypothetical protein